MVPSAATCSITAQEEAVDLPPVQVEMVRMPLPGRQEPPACRQPATPDQDVLIASVVGVPLCKGKRIRIDMPPGWPVTPPPPLGSKPASRAKTR
jgi:hypothetical protein